MPTCAGFERAASTSALHPAMSGGVCSRCASTRANPCAPTLEQILHSASVRFRVRVSDNRTYSERCTQTHGIVGVLTTKLKRSIHCVCKMLTVMRKGCFIQSISYLIITVPHPRIIDLVPTTEIAQLQPALPRRCCDLHQINK